MQRWKFLLQREGDRTWSSLDDTNLEILQGRYRIMAQTDSPNTDISIRICHLATAEDPPKRRIQKRSHCTNGNGLMVVTPFTYLQPGNWDFSCFFTDPMSDLMGDMLHQAVQLQVLACVPDEQPVAEDASDAEVNSQSVVSPILPAEDALTEATPTVQDLAGLNVEIAQALGVSMDRLVAMTDQLTSQLIAEIFHEFNLSTEAEPTPEVAISIAPETDSLVDCLPDVPEAVQPEPVPVPVPVPAIAINQLQIVLAQESWMATTTEPLTIAGRLDHVPAPSEPDSNSFDPDLEGVIPQELQVQLRNPQTSEVLFHACQSFPAGVPPLPFNFLCRLPENLETHLLLGEVIIAGVLPGAESVLITLKTVHFTVTVDPEKLVEEWQKVTSALAAETEAEGWSDLVTQCVNRLQQEQTRSRLDLSFLNMAAPVPKEVEQSLESVTQNSMVAKNAIVPKQQILPPQLYQPSEALAGKRKLELPMFIGASTKSRQATIAPELAVATGAGLEEVNRTDEQTVAQASQQTEDIDRSMPSIGFDSGNSEATGACSDTLPPDQPNALTAEGDRDGDTPPPAKEKPEQPVADQSVDLSMIEELSSPIRQAFQALNLQDRFLSRLSSMAADAELVTLMKLTMPQPEESPALSPEQVVAGEPPSVSVVMPELETTELGTTEIVVDDDPTWREWVKRAGSRSKSFSLDGKNEAENPLILPPDHPIPLPILETGMGMIEAGKPINVRVKLPSLLPKGLPPKIYVKLWVIDRETRTLLDGPRWLVDFLPNGFDQLEAFTQLTAPYGSLNIRLEAIAVEMPTQRESQKASLDCEVLPADLPDSLFEEFDYS